MEIHTNIEILHVYILALKERCHLKVSWPLVPQKFPKFPGGGEGAPVPSVTLHPNHHHRLSER